MKYDFDIIKKKPFVPYTPSTKRHISHCVDCGTEIKKKNAERCSACCLMMWRKKINIAHKTARRIIRENKIDQ